MNEINFLPEAFIKQRARKKRVRRQALLIAVALACMGGWFAHSFTQVRAMQRDVELAEEQARTVNNQATQTKVLLRRRAELINEVRLRRQLVSPVRTADVIATLADLAPPAVTVLAVEIHSGRVDPKPSTTGRGKSTRGEDKETPQRYVGWTKMQLALDAVAPSDEHIADFVARLNEHPAFGDVKIRYTRSGQVGNFLVRRFRIDLEVPLDCDYRAAAAPGDMPKGVASVD